MDKPPKRYKLPAVVECSRGYSYAVLDAFFAVMFSAAGISETAALVQGEADESAWFVSPLSFLFAGTLGASGYFGTNWASRCRDFQERRSQAIEIEREREIRKESASHRVATQLPKVVTNRSALPPGTAQLRERFDPASDELHVSYSYAVGSSMTLSMKIVIHGGTLASERVAVALSFSASSDAALVKITEVQILADGAALLPIPVTWSSSSDSAEPQDALAGSANTSYVIASLGQAARVVLRAGDGEIVLSAQAVELLREFLRRAEAKLPQKLGPLQMRPRVD